MMTLAAQEALRQEREQHKQQCIVQGKAEREAAAERRWQIAQQTAKERHRGY